MEGLLKPGVHYVEIADDFSDVEKKISYYENHPDEAEQIIANANAYTKQFFNPEIEDLLSYLVIKRYLELSRPT
jgi:spore maturation protein CgeB